MPRHLNKTHLILVKGKKDDTLEELKCDKLIIGIEFTVNGN